MNTKEIALVVIFAAITIVLTPYRIPSIYLPGVYYTFNEIPVIVAFLLFNPIIAVIIAVLKMFSEIVLFPGPAVFVGRPIIFALTLSTLFGIYLARWFLKRNPPHNSNRIMKPIVYFTAFGAFFRMIVAPILNYPMWRFAVPELVGVPFSHDQVMAMMPAFMIMAATLSLYSVPLGYLIAKIIARNLKTENLLP